MNNKDALQLLADYLHDFQIHPRFMKELSSLIKKELKGKEERFFKILITQLKNLKSFGIMIHTVDSNEKFLGKDENFYSIHLSGSQFNIRFLVHISESTNPQLLVAFYERNGKRSTDYSQYTTILEQRLKELEQMEDL